MLNQYIFEVDHEPPQGGSPLYINSVRICNEDKEPVGPDLLDLFENSYVFEGEDIAVTVMMMIVVEMAKDEILKNSIAHH